jgi:hypothetical protein
LIAPTVIRYDGRTSEIFGLSLRVGFLTLITIGIYRFWATTRVRRWFWSRITIDDQRLEYSGTGFELFVAFVKVALVLVVVLIPLRLAETFYNFAGIISLAQLLLLGLLYVLGGYYARRYPDTMAWNSRELGRFVTGLFEAECRLSAADGGDLGRCLSLLPHRDSSLPA